MKIKEVPEIVVSRLPLYLKTLSLLEKEGRRIVNSEEMGKKLGFTAAQIRRDLNYFGKFGQQGKGYNIKNLRERISDILGLDREWSMVLVGVGRLGKAILNYEGFPAAGFKISAAFDIDPNLIGKKVGNLIIQDVKELPNVICQLGLKIAIVATPAKEAQQVIDELVRCGIKAILNYAPIVPKVPPEVKVRNIDPLSALQSMTYFIKSL